MTPRARLAWIFALAFALGCGPRPAAPALAPTGSAAAPTGAVSAAAKGAAETPLAVGPDDPSRGAADALVTIVEFADLECPFCARAHQTMRELGRRYGVADLRIVWKHRPLAFHAKARPLAVAGAAVRAARGDGAFFAFVDRVFETQPRLDGAELARITDELAGPIDEAAHGRAEAKVDADVALAERVGATGTPTFFVNGARVTGAEPLSAFVALVDEELAKARALVAAGTPRADVLATRVRENVAAGRFDEPRDDEAEPDDDARWRVPVGGSPVRGNPRALVTIVEFSDFECPFCKRVQPTLEALRSRYGDDVRLVWKHLPLAFHPHAGPAAELAEEARAEKGDAGFWAAHDALFAAAPKLDDDDLAAVGKSLGLSATKLADALAGKRRARAIDDDADLADSIRASGTPHFFVNGKRLVGAQPLAAFTAVIDAELAHAKELVARGVAPGDVYAELTKDARVEGEAPRHAAPKLAGTEPWRGAARAAVVIQEFSDFECPFCRRAEASLEQLLAAYPTKVRVVFRHRPLPMHRHAEEAALAAEEARAQKGNAAFFAMGKKLFAAQAKEGGLERGALVAYARELGLDVARFEKALDARAHAAAIARDVAAGDEAGVEGVPVFFVGDVVVEGAQPYVRFRRAVEAALGPRSP